MDESTGGQPSHEHPVGTLAIVGVFGLLFVVGWLLVYFLIFTPRGAVTP